MQQSPQSQFDRGRGLRESDNDDVDVPGTSSWSRLLWTCLQGCGALVLGGLVCLVLAWASPATVIKWPMVKDFARRGLERIRDIPSAAAANRVTVDENHDSSKPSEGATDIDVAIVDPLQTGTAAQPAGSAGWSNELEARAAMERMFRVPFPKCRPPWLLNPTTGRNLELDLYSEALKLAVEVDGRQHAEWPNAFHATREMFEQQRLRDTLKDTLCGLRGVRLLRVPHTVKRKDIASFLRAQLSLGDDVLAAHIPGTGSSFGVSGSGAANL